MENKRRLCLFLVALMMVSLLLAGCDKSLEALSSKVEKNMSKREVVDILGRDYEKYEHDDDEFSLVWISEDKSEVVEVYFDDDKEVDDVDWMDEDDWEEWLEEIETKGRVSYDDFMDGFDDTLDLLIETNEQEILLDTKFEKGEPNELNYMLEMDGIIVCLITLEIKDEYVNQAIISGRVEVNKYLEYTVILLSAMETGMLGEIVTDLEYDELYTFGSYEVMTQLQDYWLSEIIQYAED